MGLFAGIEVLCVSRSPPLDAGNSSRPGRVGKCRGREKKARVGRKIVVRFLARADDGMEEARSGDFSEVAETITDSR